jgi:ATP-dependent Clp protease adaptor protein ClpS
MRRAPAAAGKSIRNAAADRQPLARKILCAPLQPSNQVIIFNNDDYTTMEFVVEVLVYVFQKSSEEAMRIMLNVHRVGVGVCGLYPYEVAETKVDTVDSLARENGFPLKCVMERD